MRTNRLFLSLLLAGAAGLCACGTIVDGGTQTVDVVVKGSPNAFCEFSTKNFRNTGRFPNKVNLERSKDDLNVDCKGEQNRHTAFVVKSEATAAGTTGNLATGVIPGLGYDLASGGLWRYPDPIIVDFRTVGEGPQPEWPANKADVNFDPTRVGTAPIAPPVPLRMQPILDEQLNPALPKRRTQPTASEQPKIIDATRIAIEKPQPVVVKSVTQTTTPASGIVPLEPAQMNPVLSPEDKMGANPGKVKAEAAAKQKAKEEAKRKAEQEAAKPKTEQPAASVQTLPESQATPPSEPAPAQATPATPAPTPVPTQADEPSKTEGSTSAAPKDDMDKYLQGQ